MATSPATLPPYLPECSSGFIASTDFNPTDVIIFQPDQWNYYSQEVLPSTIPGIVLGSICLLGFIFFFIWTCVVFCCCCRHRRSADDVTQEQFLKQEGSLGAATFGLDQNYKDPDCGCGRPMQIIIVLLMLATVGCSAWGIAVSLQETDTQISAFWNLSQNVETKVDNTTASMQLLSNQLGTLQTSLQTLQDNDSELRGNRLLSSFGIGSALDQLEDVNGAITDVRASIAEGITAVEASVGETIESMQNDFQEPSTTFEDTGRMVAIVILFSFVIVAALGAGLLSLRVRHPFWASIFVLLLWLFLAFVMLLGMGVLKGVHTVSRDACLYVENYALNYAQSRVSDPTKRQWIVNSLQYYLNDTTYAVEAPGEALKAVTGVDLIPVLEIINSTEVQTLIAAAEDPNINAALTSQGVSQDAVNVLLNISSLIQPTTATLLNLEAQASKAQVLPLVDEVKTLICCEVSKSSDDLFIAWTIVGCVGLVLALLTSWRVQRHAFRRRSPWAA